MINFLAQSFQEFIDDTIKGFSTVGKAREFVRKKTGIVALEQKLGDFNAEKYSQRFNIPLEEAKKRIAKSEEASSLAMGSVSPLKILKGEKVVEGVSKFAQRAKPVVSTIAKESIKEIPITYAKQTFDDITKVATERVKTSPDTAKNFVYESILGKGEPTGETTATAIELLKYYTKSGKHQEAVNLLEVISPSLSKSGQYINAAKLLPHTSPNAILLRAQKTIERANKSKLFLQKEYKLTDETAKQLYQLGEQMQSAKGATQVELAEQIEAVLQGLKRPSIGRVVSATQTIAQLLNPKTAIRNVLGNEIFYRLERLNHYITTPIDIVRSIVTGGKRAVTFRTQGQGGYWAGWMRGAKGAFKGTTPEGLTTQYEIYAPVFKSKYNPFTYLEKTLGVELRAADLAAYTRAKNQTIGELGYLKALTEGHKGKTLTEVARKYAQEADTEILSIAEQYGKYVTFQDENLISKGASAVKKGLNIGKEFGVGDLVIKYPKTPGALLSRALEYSPAGFVKSAYILAKAFLKQGKIPLEATREIELALSRAITGTLGATGLGYYLADKGIITGEGTDDYDVESLKRGIGAGKYRVNISALQRWVTSGFRDVETQAGDRFYSYDWAQPIAVSLSIGANINEAGKAGISKETKLGRFANVPSTAVSSLAGGLETLTEQPLVRGIKKLFETRNPIEAGIDIIETAPASFTPTLLNQIAQIDDNIVREKYDPSLLKRTLNNVKARIPGLKETLPPKYTTLGEQMNVYQNPSILNVMFNPAFVSTYQPTSAAQLVLEVYNDTGDKKHFPKVVPKYITFYGKKFDFTGEQISEFQKSLGTSTNAIFTELANSQRFQKADSMEKAKLLNYALTKIWEREKLKILTGEQKKYLIESLTDKQKDDFVKRIKKALE